MQTFYIKLKIKTPLVVKLDNNKFCLVGSRLYVFKFEEYKNFEEKALVNTRVLPQLVYLPDKKLLYFGTQNEIVGFNICDGFISSTFNH